jgi:hypothetical protein
MDSELRARLKDARRLCDLVGKKSGIPQNFIFELRSLSDTFGYLSEYESKACKESWEQFWKRFAHAIDGCQGELATMERILDGISQQDQTDRELALRRIDQHRPNIVLCFKTATVAMQVMTLFVHLHVCSL